MKKKCLTLLLALAMCLTLLPSAAFAAGVSNVAGVNLTPGERRIYNALEKVMLEINAGTRSDTQTAVTFDARELGWTAQELGFTALDNNNQAVLQAVMDRLNASLFNIYISLEYNYPYDLFFDAGGLMRYEFYWQNIGSELWLTDLTVSLIVSPDYQWYSDTTVNLYERAKAVAGKEVAQRIVAENAGKSNYEKLEAYRDAICRLTDYDEERASHIATGDYVFGYPAQASSVFDGDESTLTICVGYARAFKYLCDLTDWDGDVRCYLAGGDAVLGSESGGHTWNVVRMEDGKYYLTDITASDSGIFGKNHPLLACSNEPAENYNYQTALYTYGDYSYGLYTDGWLPALSTTPYEPGHAVAPTPTPTPTPTPVPTSNFTDVKPGAYYADAVQWAVGKKITNGKTTTTFAPNESCTHGQILTFLWRAAGEPASNVTLPFAVTGREYYLGAAKWAYEKGMIGANFNANAPCTRADAVNYIWQAAGRGAAGYDGRFTDIPANSPYATAVAWAVANGVTNGATASTFNPNGVCSRGQIVTFLHRYFGK